MDKHTDHGPKGTIEARYGCHCRYAGVTHVTETAADGRAWDGNVETFELIGHDRATLCFTWLEKRATGLERVTALSPPVKSPAWAVRVYLMAQGRAAAV